MISFIEFLYLGLVLHFTSANYHEYDYSEFDPNSKYNSDETIEDCNEPESNQNSENGCFCYDEPENDMAYSICKESGTVMLFFEKPKILFLPKRPSIFFTDPIVAICKDPLHISADDRYEVIENRCFYFENTTGYDFKTAQKSCESAFVNGAGRNLRPHFGTFYVQDHPLGLKPIRGHSITTWTR